MMNKSFNSERYIILGAAKALHHWLNYLADVNRAAIINEGSIRYGMSEYLEVSKYNYCFEYAHPVLFDRAMDLAITLETVKDFPKADLFDNKGKYFAVEFKHIRALTDREIQRHFEDICRLALCSRNNGNNKSYFLVFGNTEVFANAYSGSELLDDLDEDQLNSNKPSGQDEFDNFIIYEDIQIERDLKPIQPPIIREWLSFDASSPKKDIHLNSEDQDWIKDYSVWQDEYLKWQETHIEKGRKRKKKDIATLKTTAKCFEQMFNNNNSPYKYRDEGAEKDNKYKDQINKLKDDTIIHTELVKMFGSELISDESNKRVFSKRSDDFTVAVWEIY